MTAWPAAIKLARSAGRALRPICILRFVPICPLSRGRAIGLKTRAWPVGSRRPRTSGTVESPPPPGVEWTRPFVAGGVKGLGLSDSDTFVIIEEGQLVGVDVYDGRTRWRRESDEPVENGLLDEERRLIYTADRRGRLAAYPLTAVAGDSDQERLQPAAEPAWTVKLDAIGYPTPAAAAEWWRGLVGAGVVFSP